MSSLAVLSLRFARIDKAEPVLEVRGGTGVSGLDKHGRLSAQHGGPVLVITT